MEIKAERLEIKVTSSLFIVTINFKEVVFFCFELYCLKGSLRGSKSIKNCLLEVCEVLIKIFSGLHTRSKFCENFRSIRPVLAELGVKLVQNSPKFSNILEKETLEKFYSLKKFLFIYCYQCFQTLYVIDLNLKF